MKITKEQLFKDHAVTNEDDLPFDWMDVTPAMCSEGCMTEPDGHCPHGHPSFFLEMGWC